MAVTVDERPYDFCFSKNEIRYTFTLDQLTRAGLLLQVKIMYKYNDETTYTPMPALALKPNTDGKVYLNIEHYIDSILSFDLPNVVGDLTHARNQYCQFYVEYRDVDDTTTPSYDNTENANIRIALKGGIAKEKFSRNNFFINYFNDEKPFLTWQPSNRFIFANQPMYLTFFAPNGITNDDVVRVTTTTFGLNGETISDDSGLPNNNGLLFHLRVSDYFIQDPFLNKISFEILNPNTSVYIAKSYTFNFHFRPIYNIYEFIWFNSLGGIDFIRFRGDSEIGINKNFEEIEGGFDNNESFNDYKSHHVLHNGINFTKSIKADVGFLNSKIEQDALIELLISPKIYYFEDERFIPILNVQKSMNIRKNSDDLFSFPIEFITSIQNVSYTPSHINLGKGNNS